MNEVVLTGLDGSNPLGFLAALGALNVLSDRSKGEPAPTLRWRPGDWRPVISGPIGTTLDAVVDAVISDRDSWRGEPCLDLKYKKAKDEGKQNAKEAWDLKPPPARLRAYLDSLARSATAKTRRTVDFAAAFATEAGQDNNGNSKPTALHFTAGQQEFLAMVGELCDGLLPSDITEALAGPWRYERPLPVLGWDATAGRDYALRASDPSKDKKRGVPGADWLAFRGLSFIRVAPRPQQTATVGCSGGWKSGTFRWPLWDVPLPRPTIQVLLGMPNLLDLKEQERRARGISIVFRSGIRRSEQGGYGSFAPAAVL